jgi:hypothetical protein
VLGGGPHEIEEKPSGQNEQKVRGVAGAAHGGPVAPARLLKEEKQTVLARARARGLRVGRNFL